MANYYRDQIGALREALGDEHAQVQMMAKGADNDNEPPEADKANEA